ncbi:MULTISPECIES: M23 family metallopeptidase [Streptomyces]|uniref:M23 family metallopeptidase n=1 Tax=Streptomyces caniscabiei TaxID=2746961 RepID=A0ABU4MGT9_9ACTN|nr:MULTISPECIES: M23 family metallopeptidase [Streptomyces]MDX2942791.1 M23 family metallopeptidase [Streptomyces caniscabiei]MDX2953001.1 M23 family metallopeptidase [Streptomyces caniscabiei]MDX2984935.1 M23 family metallopeptidase [Streptomyces caniscabiei]MDX3007872.1 M23 family metallopeptidase [Streptomyces caniscabiei]MDX3036555.1 M23 family metallopeptidase [Streptomyces caniscabiei]
MTTTTTTATATGTPARRRTAVALAATAVALSFGLTAGGSATAAPASTSASAAGDVAAAAKPRFQMPFKCNTHWRIDTWGHNPAIDMVVKGNTGSSGKPVYPGYKGKVVKAYKDSGAGNMIIINHGGGWYTAYYHLKDSATKYVKVGQTVGAKKQIGRVGATGKNSGNHAHLHYEQRYRTNGIPTEKHRKPVHFNGKSYTGKSKTWKDVVSKNC